ncbi:hypothetical protein VNI00_007937 [Paramarasmius palmivorus]|uniref:Tat pathway signal sequence n=1 Tax=Paramarasmius palmivorus TaxID=297713 RepID=A0AAW0CZH6_9AGAR
MRKDEYHPLMLSEEDAPEDGVEAIAAEKQLPKGKFKKYAPSYRVLVILVVLQFILLLLCVASIFFRKPPAGSELGRVLYSPALEVVEPQIKVFHVGFPGDLSPFQIPSSPELDEAWEDLYQFGISKITKDQAMLLPNKTWPIPGDEEHYVAELDVFHNLHCLNMVRKALDPAYYTDWNIAENKESAKHVSHCLDWVRQSIMCHADTSVIVWQWEDWANETIVKGDVAHTCRNFEKIRDWAKERTLGVKFNGKPHLESNIQVPIFHADDL